MTTQNEIPWLGPDPMGCLKAFLNGDNVLLEFRGSVTWNKEIRSIMDQRYRILPPTPKTYTLAEAQVAYCEGKWIAVYGAPNPRWRHVEHCPLGSAMTYTGDWMISDTDPRKAPNSATFRCGTCKRRVPFPVYAIVDDEGLCAVCAQSKPDPQEDMTMPADPTRLVGHKPVPRPCDVHEALRVWVAGGTVSDPDGLARQKDGKDSAEKPFMVYLSDIGKPWTVVKEPPNAERSEA